MQAGRSIQLSAPGFILGYRRSSFDKGNDDQMRDSACLPRMLMASHKMRVCQSGRLGQTDRCPGRPSVLESLTGKHHPWRLRWQGSLLA
jgi:hypothetical protein